MLKDTEFKKAIEQLSDKEKLALILRLLKKDKILTEKMYFEMVDTDSVEDKRSLLAEKLEIDCLKTAEKFTSIKSLLNQTRNMSQKISHHLKITKDKYGEIELNIKMLSQVIQLNNVYVLNSKPEYSHKFCIYIINKVYRILILILALHEDYFLDLKANLETLGNTIANNQLLMKYAINNGLDINWLIDGEIPENIAETLKIIKANGFLR